MSEEIHDLRIFYKGRRGRVVQRVLQSHIDALWPDVKSMNICGYGYAIPYLGAFQDSTDHYTALVPSFLGAHYWPRGGKNRVALCEDIHWPLETESVDRLLMTHSFSPGVSLSDQLQEAWRVMKSNGRLILMVPNRMGLWARADWTPFGQGVPYSLRQIMMILKDHNFMTEDTERALFMPPMRSFLAWRVVTVFESFGRFVMPGMAGVYLIEVSKQVYARPKSGSVVAAKVRKVRATVAKPSAG